MSEKRLDTLATIAAALALMFAVQGAVAGWPSLLVAALCGFCVGLCRA